MDFSDALRELRKGNKVARAGWNGKGMFIYAVCGSGVEVNELRNEAKTHYPKNGKGPINICSHIDMKAADGSIVVGWLASQTDIFATDWEVV